MENTNLISSNKHEKTDEWFEKIINLLQLHHLQLTTSTASEEVTALYELLMDGDNDIINYAAKLGAQKHFVRRIILSFLQTLTDISKFKLAFDFNDSQVLVWAEIEDDNEELEKELILAGAEVDAKFYEYGWAISIMVVEKSDGFEIPPHYKKLLIKED